MREGALSDRLSPILVKEVRQGVKAHLFTGALLVLQLLMIGSVMLGLALRTTPAWGAGTSAIFWTMAGLPLLVVMPLSGVRSVSGEVQGKTLELVLLTRMCAYRIIVGKWAAIVFETLLLATTILPYVVLRYFLGGIDLWRELLGLGAALILSALFSALTVSFSALRITVWLKWTLVGVFAYTLVMQIFALLRAWSLSPRPFSLGFAWIPLTGFALVVFLLLFEVAAVAIAPPAENHMTRIRLLALLGIGVGAASVRLVTSETAKGFLAFVTFLILVPVCVGCLCEPVRRIRSLYAPFFRPRALLRPVAPLLCPGWPSGVVFTAFAAPLAVLAFASDWPALSLRSAVSLLGALLLPLAVIRSFPRIFARFQRTLPAYLVLSMVTGLPVYALGAGKVLGNPSLVALAKAVSSVFPLSYFSLDLFSRQAAIRWTPAEHAVQIGVCLGIFIVIFLATRRGWREIRALTGSAPSLAASDLEGRR